MNEFFKESVYAGVVLSMGAYMIGAGLRKKFKKAFLNPLLISIIITIVFLLIFRIDYDNYYEGAKYISYLLTPATVSLAIPLYAQLEQLKKNWKAITAGILSGVITSIGSVILLAFLLGFNHNEYVTFLPKSITTAIGMGVSEELGGYVAVTAAVIIITGVFGNLIADGIFKLFKINEPVARGIALGTSSHAVGTAKAMELGEVEGAMSGLSIVVAGIITVIMASFFAQVI